MAKEKLTYEQLEAYANQTVANAQRIYKENKLLLKEIENLKNQRNYTEISLAFKALDHKECFSAEFIEKISKRLEEVLTPMDKEPQEEEETPKE